MLQARIFIDTRSKTRKGFPIKLQIYCTLTQQRKYIHTKLYQKSKTKIPIEAQDELTKLLTRLKPLHDLTLEEAYPLLNQEGDLEIMAMKMKLEKHKAFVEFFGFTDVLISEKEVKGMSITSFMASKREIKKYVGQDTFNLNDITYNWVKDFKLYKFKNGTNEGGISYYLRTIRTIYNEAIKRDLGVKDTKPFKGQISNTTSAEHDLKNWKISDIHRLQKFEHSRATDLTKFNMQRVIDLFMFQVAIGGHDLVDVANLRRSNIKDGRLVFKRFKNRNKPLGGRTVNNTLLPFAQEIIDKYWDRKSDQLFPFLGDPQKGTYTHRLFYATLKRISNELKISPPLATKTPRYIFRTVAGEQLVHDLIVENILGHKPTTINRSYQKSINHEVQDEAHEKIFYKIHKNFKPFF